jgi:hypothetical protein
MKHLSAVRPVLAALERRAAHRGAARTFRADANRVLKLLFDRIGRENRDFYPMVEAA